MPPLLKVGKQAAHFPPDVFRIAEGAPVFEYAHRSEPPRPRIDILKQVMMQGAIMRHAQPSSGQRFVGTLRRHRRLEFLQGRLVANASEILENRCTWIAVRVCYGVVHATLRFGGILPGKQAAPLGCRQALAIELPEIFLKPAARLDAFDLADLCKPIPANRVRAGPRWSLRFHAPTIAHSRLRAA